MRIVIDMQGAQTMSRRRGIGRYTLSFTEALIKLQSEHEFILLFNSLLPKPHKYIHNIINTYPEKTCCLEWKAIGPTCYSEPANLWRRRASELIREDFIRNLNPDFTIMTSLFEGYSEDAVTTLMNNNSYICQSIIFYDLIPYLHKNIYLKCEKSRTWYNDKINHLKKSDLIFTISNHAKNELIENIDVKNAEIENIYAASNCIEFSNDITEPADSEFKELINTDYVLTSGGSEQRKNLKVVISAFQELPLHIKNNINLVAIGFKDQKDINDYKKYLNNDNIDSKNIVFIDYVNDKNLKLLYSKCILFVFPSWHEGFGFPVLEAMQCGVPVVASNATSIPEIIQDKEALFNPFSIDCVKSKLITYLTNSQKRDKLRKYCINQSSKFSWRNTANVALQSIEIYDRINKNKTKHEIHGDLISSICDINLNQSYPTQSDMILCSEAIETNELVIKNYRYSNS